MALKFVSIARHKAFEYKPLYYNQGKDELEQRVKQIQADIELEKKGLSFRKKGSKTPIFSGYMRQRLQREQRSSQIRIAVILALLLLVAYLSLKVVGI